MTTNYFIWMLVKPSHLIVIMAFLGVLLWRTKVGRWCRVTTVVCVVAFGLLPTGALLIRPLETRFDVPQTFDRVDGVILLAGGELARLSEIHGQPQLSSMGDRLTTFLLLAERHPSAQLIHSGRRESKVARELLLGAGIESDRVYFDDESENTCESAGTLRKRIDPDPDDAWLLVTSGFHMPRAVACFRASDWEITPYPSDFRTGRSPFHFSLVSNLENLDLAAHEWLGLLYYRLRGRTSELFPAAL